jgi:P27 family predicted phage terminase small subunit
MVRGPARKPTGLRLIEGTDRRGRTGPGKVPIDLAREPRPLEGDMVPPYAMAEAPLRIWHETVAQLVGMGLAFPADARQLAAYCEAAALAEEASRLIAETTMLVRGSRPDTVVINKLLLIQERAAAQIRLWAQEFGLTPAARARVETQPPTGRGDDNPFSGV